MAAHRPRAEKSGGLLFCHHDVLKIWGSGELKGGRTSVVKYGSSIGSNYSNRLGTILHRGKVKINRLLGNAHPNPRTAHESTCCLPYEIVEMVVANLTHDPNTLKACSLVCRSMYTAAAPHIHHTLHLREKSPGILQGGLEPLSKLHKLGLVPFVKEVLVSQRDGVRGWLVPQVFTPRDLRYFSAFKNVQTLRIQGFDLDCFMPDIERYFEQFSATLQYIGLFCPTCTPQQLSYFLSLFPNLDNIEIVWGILMSPGRSKEIPRHKTFALPPAPKLRRWLMLHTYCRDEDWTDFITLYCGLGFRHIELDGVVRRQLLQEVCAETLETLRFYVANGSIGISLSRFKALRSLQVVVLTERAGPGDAHDATVLEAFSTITSPVFSELVIVLQGVDAIMALLSEVALFQTLSRMNEIRPFKLVFLLEGMGCLREERLMMEGVIRRVVEESSLDFLASPATIRLNEFRREWLFRRRFCV